MSRLPTLAFAVLLALLQCVGQSVGFARGAARSSCAARPCCRHKVATATGPALHAEKPCCRRVVVTQAAPTPATLRPAHAGLAWIATPARVSTRELPSVSAIAFLGKRATPLPAGIGRGLPYRLQV